MKLVLAAVLVAFTSSVVAQSTYVRPHVRKDGTYVEGHHRTAPNNTRVDNYGTQGNTNPWTGQQGTASPHPQQPSPYSSPSPYGGSNRGQSCVGLYCPN